MCQMTRAVKCLFPGNSYTNNQLFGLYHLLRDRWLRIRIWESVINLWETCIGY